MSKSIAGLKTLQIKVIILLKNSLSLFSLYMIIALSLNFSVSFFSPSMECKLQTRLRNFARQLP